MTTSKLPPIRRTAPYVRDLLSQGFTLINQGKVRDAFAIPGIPGAILLVASDGISIYDFVLPSVIPSKGEILTTLTHFWMNVIFPDILSDQVAMNMTQYLRKRYSAIPAKRSLVVYDLKMMPYEMIFRYHLGGSIFREYQEKGTAAGQSMPVGLPRWAKLNVPVFTPSTKEFKGHDVNIMAEEFFARTGSLGRMAVERLENLYITAYGYAFSRGIIILDTKFEVGNAIAPWARGTLRVADEVLTPDSSRFAMVEDVQEALRSKQDPRFFDKQMVRDWGAQIETPWGPGIGNLDPRNPDHVSFVREHCVIPPSLVEETRARYHRLFQMLTGYTLEEYQREFFS